MTTGEGLGTALAGLGRASRHRLAEHWAEYFGAAPPPRTSRSLMIRAVAYKLQERELGGLLAATRRLLYRQGPAPVRRRDQSLPAAAPLTAGRALLMAGLIIAGGLVLASSARPARPATRRAGGGDDRPWLTVGHRFRRRFGIAPRRTSNLGLRSTSLSLGRRGARRATRWIAVNDPAARF
jgi:Protein of unknown function (DUF2924)